MGMGVLWERHAAGDGGRRLRVGSEVLCIAECGGRVCCGCWDGTIAVWDRATLTLERTLPANEGGGEVWYLDCSPNNFAKPHRNNPWTVALSVILF